MVAWATSLSSYPFARAFVEWQIPFVAKRVTQTRVSGKIAFGVFAIPTPASRDDGNGRLIRESVIYDLLTKNIKDLRKRHKIWTIENSFSIRISIL